MLRRSFEFRTPLRICGRNTDWAVVEVTLTDVDTAHCDHGDRSEVKLLCTEDRPDDDVLTITEATISTKSDTVTEIVEDESLLCL